VTETSEGWRFAVKTYDVRRKRPFLCRAKATA